MYKNRFLKKNMIHYVLKRYLIRQNVNIVFLHFVAYKLNAISKKITLFALKGIAPDVVLILQKNNVLKNGLVPF